MGPGGTSYVLDNTLRNLQEHPDLDELHIAARTVAYFREHYKPRELRMMLLEAFGAADDTHPQRQAAELAIKREFREVDGLLAQSAEARARDRAREARRFEMLEYEEDRDWARRTAKLVAADDNGAAAAELYVDITSVLEGDMTPLSPDRGGVRADGERMLYGGTVNGLVGESEAGKTIIAACMAADELRLGGSVLWGDLDHNGAEGTVRRLVEAGVDLDVLRDPSRFRLVVTDGRAGVVQAVEDAETWRPTMAVVDSVGELVPMFGGDSNNADDYSRVHREVFARLAASGAAVLVIDHLAKTALGTGYASGTGAKKRAMDGAYYGVKSVEPLRPGAGGASALTILKDRFGGVRATTSSATAAVFRLDSRHDQWSWEFYLGRSDDERSADGLEGDVATVLALPVFPTSRTALQGALRAINGKGWNNERARIALAEATKRRTTTFPLDPRTTDK